MPVNLQIVDLPNEVHVRVTEPRRFGKIVSFFLGTVIAAYVFRQFISGSGALATFVVGLFAVSFIRELISILRGTDVELKANNLDFISTGHAPQGYKPSNLSRADIYGLEYRKASGGGDTPDFPEGLYIEHHGFGRWNPSTCVLPHINKAQAEQVIETILRRFPDTGTLPPTGPFEPYLTSLNLNRPREN
jgi:hypothetical protein